VDAKKFRFLYACGIPFNVLCVDIMVAAGGIYLHM
jgi:hypothetical protein